MKKTGIVASMMVGIGIGYACSYMKDHPIKMKAMKNNIQNNIQNAVKDLK